MGVLVGVIPRKAKLDIKMEATDSFFLPIQIVHLFICNYYSSTEAKQSSALTIEAELPFF
jgi:hypothetical protein